MGVKEGYILKSGYFADIGLFNVKTVADRHIYASTGHVLFSGK